MFYLFTYGTLQAQQRNHPRIQGRFLHAQPALCHGWQLWHHSLGDYPAILPDGQTLLRGTLFTFAPEIEADVLSECDALEEFFPDDIERSRYLRVQELITPLDPDTLDPLPAVHAHIYQWNPLMEGVLSAFGEVVPEGDWLAARPAILARLAGEKP